jgi:hypothetical protein
MYNQDKLKAQKVKFALIVRLIGCDYIPANSLAVLRAFEDEAQATRYARFVSLCPFDLPIEDFEDYPFGDTFRAAFDEATIELLPVKNGYVYGANRLGK